MAASRRRPLRRAMVLVPALALAGCGGGGGGSAGTAAFKPVGYAFLTPLRLNVGQVRVEDHVPPPAGPEELGPGAPVPPEDALRRMAQDRLVAAGNSGTAVFTIDQASITGQPGGTLDGTLAVHLDIIGNGGGHSGYAEAHVSHEYVPGTGDGDAGGLKAQLYALTNTMMGDMNVEFEYQLRRTLGDWLVDASGAPLSAAVQQQSLSPSDGGNAAGPAPEPSPASVGAPVQLAPPSPVALDPSAPPPPQSPPPGFLQAPPGAQPVPDQGQLSAPVPFQPNADAGHGY